MDIVMLTNDCGKTDMKLPPHMHLSLRSFGNSVAVLTLGARISYGYEAMSKLVNRLFYNSSKLTASDIHVFVDEASLVGLDC